MAENGASKAQKTAFALFNSGLMHRKSTIATKVTTDNPIVYTGSLYSVNA